VKAKAPRNLPASIRQRLLNHAKTTGSNFQEVLVRYGTERLLYRLSLSEYRERFLLKGAILFAAWTGAPHRATRDADFLATDNLSVDKAVDILRTVVQIEPPEPDGLTFDAAQVDGEQIREGTRYGGARVKLRATLDGAQITLQVDLAIGEAVEPPPVMIELPSLLGFPPARLLSYPPEVSIAEKFEAIVSLGMANSRMKDYYDIWYLYKHRLFDSERLKRSVKATFTRRATPIPTNTPDGLTEEFAKDPERENMWRAFLVRSAATVDEGQSLWMTVEEIRPFLMDIAS
jgi:predicted nucleotidyltransferase component of viral defense system